MTSVWLSLFAIVVLVALNGFFVATEFALVKVRPTQLHERAKAGSRSARHAEVLVGSLDEYLSATQLGITLASLALGWIGEPAFEHLLGPTLTRLGLSDASRGVASATAAFLITFLHIVFGELAPKSIAIQRAEGTSLAVALPMRAFYVVFYPGIWLLNGLARLALKAIGLGTAGDHGDHHTEEELRLIVHAMRDRQKSGSKRRQLDVMDRALRLPTRTARDLMVPRTEIAALKLGDDLEDLRARVRETKFTRYPVIEEDLDHIVGVLNLKDLYGNDGRRSLRDMLRAPLFVPVTMRAEQLIRELRRTRQHLAVVVDEYGGTAGIVTMADVVVAVMGDLEPDAQISQLSEDVFSIDPMTPLSDFSSRFRVTAEEPHVTTVGGLVMARLGRIPARGDKLAVEGLELSVESMNGPRIAALVARRPKPPKE